MIRLTSFFCGKTALYWSWVLPAETVQSLVVLLLLAASQGPAEIGLATAAGVSETLRRFTPRTPVCESCLHLIHGPGLLLHPGAMIGRNKGGDEKEMNSEHRRS